jgi:nucleoporin SEH1
MDIQQFQNSVHCDIIHHVEFDFHGRRVATASSDKIVCVWDKTSSANTQSSQHEHEGTTWIRTAYWKTHGGAVWKVRWAHPEFGQVIATCSFDNNIHIFEETTTDSSDQSARTGVHVGRTESNNKWRRRATLSGAANITDIQFAPHYLGLILAACTSTGRLVVYEAEDVMELENWNSLVDVEIVPFRLSSISWSTHRFRTPLIALSSDDVNALQSEKVTIIKANFTAGFRKPEVIAQRQFTFSDQAQVTQVVFGPTCGLSYHRLAIAVGTSICVYQINVRHEEGNNDDRSGNYYDEEHISINLLDTVEGGHSQAVRLSWNVIGDIICAVYADAVIRLWKYNTFTAKWDLISSVSPPLDFEKMSKEEVYY